ncbi:ATP-binding protein [uncultured Kordia sp.]|uniref:sensor histidine kinase n=1 Tax=uncultured Kordia sp. TaxID=507699 RepID=UPI00260199B4|nr:ATP-binding protein [uncultured Kordia sp.]
MEISEEIDFIGILLPLVGIVFLIALGVIFMYQQFQKNIIRQQLEREALKNKYQKELLQTAIRVQEEERKRIASDLHDELAAALSIGYMQLTQIEDQKEFDAKRIGQIRELLQTTLTATRRISHELMPLHLAELGLEKALVHLLGKVATTQKIETNLAVSEHCSELSWILEVALYRIYSELINNTLKHAQAATIDISILCKSDQLFCQFTDDGIGLPEKLLHKGIGLQSIENRVKSFEGKFEYGNNKEGGFYCKIILPIENNI